MYNTLHIFENKWLLINHCVNTLQKLHHFTCDKNINGRLTGYLLSATNSVEKIFCRSVVRQTNGILCDEARVSDQPEKDIYKGFCCNILKGSNIFPSVGLTQMLSYGAITLQWHNKWTRSSLLCVNNELWTRIWDTIKGTNCFHVVFLTIISSAKI